MVRIRQVPRRSTVNTSPPKKRPCTTPDAKSPETVVAVPNSTCESNKFQEEEAPFEHDMMALEEMAGRKFDFDVFLSHLDKDMPKSLISPLKWNESNAGELSREGYDRALKERDLALNELNNLRAELKEVKNYRSEDLAEIELGKKVLEAWKKALFERLDKECSNFAAELKEVLESLSTSKAELEKTSQELNTYKTSLELGNRVWEAERIEMVKKIEMVNKEMQHAEAERTEMAESIAMGNKVKEKAYCKGYLDGFVKKPHAYVHAWHDARLVNDVNDLPVLQMMNNLPISHV